MTDLYCQSCKTHMATLRDAKVRNDIVVYCAPCAAKLRPKPKPEAIEMPEFFKGIFGGK